MDSERSPPPVSPRSSSLRKFDDPERIKAEAAKKREFAVTILTKNEIENGMKAFREVSFSSLLTDILSFVLSYL